MTQTTANNPQGALLTPPGALLSKGACQATRSDGGDCGAPPGLNGLCFWHDPERRQERVEAARKGGAHVEDGQDLRELVDVLRSQLQSQGEELVARRREVQELHVLLQQKALPEAVGRPWWRFWR